MIPYLQVPDLPLLGPLGVHAFGVMVAVAVWVGTSLAHRRLRETGMDKADFDRLTTWVLVAGFVGAHLVDRLLYHPEEVRADPLTLIEPWAGLSSFGGLFGAAVGGLAWRVFTGKPIWALADLICSILPVAWIFGRAGCAIVHDHPGIHTSATNPFAVAFPDGPRYDLGLLEMLCMIALGVVVAAGWRKPRPAGTYIALVCMAYAPIRFGLDFLRSEDARYAGFTPAQWMCSAMFAFGIYAAWRAWTTATASPVSG